MGRPPCCDKLGLKKGPWTTDEDRKLLAYIQEHGHGSSWHSLPSKAGLKRCGKSCRLRWTNNLRPDIKRGKFTLQEEETIIQLHALHGNRWSAIASLLPKRTDNEIKNYWNTNLKKRLTKMGIDRSRHDPLLHSISDYFTNKRHIYTNDIINTHTACTGEMQYIQNIIKGPITCDPMTHKPKNHILDSGRTKDFVNLCHMAQWESARLEAEARQVRESEVWKLTNPRKDHNMSTHNLVESPIFGLLSENDPSINYVEMCGACTPEPPKHKYQDDVMQGITENLEALHDYMMIDSVNEYYDAFGQPSFLEGFVDLSGNNGVADHDAVNDVYNWDNYTLNVMSSSQIAVSEGKSS